MAKADKDIITQLLGVEPILINSALVSGQQRKRLYWTNIPVEQPDDKGIVLQDILETNSVIDREKSRAVISSIGRTTTREYFKKRQGQLVCEPIRLGTLDGLGTGQANRIYSVKGKSICIIANSGGGGGKTGLYKVDLPDGDYIVRKLTPLECERLQTLPDNYTLTGDYDGTIKQVSDTQRYKAIGNGWTVDVIAHILKGIK